MSAEEKSPETTEAPAKVWPEDREDYDEFDVTVEGGEESQAVTEELPTESAESEEEDAEEEDVEDEGDDSESDASEEDGDSDEEDSEEDGDEDSGEDEGSPATVDIADDTILRFQADGEQVEETYAELKKSHGLAKKANRVIQEASEEKKRAEAVIGSFLEPEKALDTLADLYAQSLGGDKEKARQIIDRQVVGKRVDEIMKRESMTEEQRRIYDLEQEKARRDAELAELKERDADTANQQKMAEKASAAMPVLDRALRTFGLELGSEEGNEIENILASELYAGRRS